MLKTKGSSISIRHSSVMGYVVKGHWDTETNKYAKNGTRQIHE